MPRYQVVRVCDIKHPHKAKIHYEHNSDTIVSLLAKAVALELGVMHPAIVESEIYFYEVAGWEFNMSPVVLLQTQNLVILDTETDKE